MGDHLDTTEKQKIHTARAKRDALLSHIAPEIIRKAWFTLSHLLVDEGSHIIDMGCDDGAMTFAMAAMAPKLTFTGLDKSKKHINKAKEQFKLSNLDFKIGDAASSIFEPDSIDAIINSYILHEIYSASRYSEQSVRDVLVTHYKALKKGGILFIRDYASPPSEEYVLMEMPDEPSQGEGLEKMSYPDLLVWYAEHARPKQDAGCGGFFLEELPERYPGTRLFRLPYKWAYEFIMRKDDRKAWESELPIEYIFFTMQDFRKEMRNLGARLQYSGPYYDDEIISEKFDGQFRLYQDNGEQLGNPPTCYIAVAYKMAERKSLYIEERRPSSTDSGNLKITAMRDENTGNICDIVSRDIDISEIIPYRIDDEGRLKLYLHDGIARSIANAVPRGGVNIDERRWSGHMIEPITVDGEAIATLETLDHKNSVLFGRDYLGLKPEGQAVIKKGPDYYPAPDYIDERIHTYYLNVRAVKNAIQPKSTIGVEKFQAKGMVREMDAQQILNAITVGMIPNARLELQILSLYQHLNIRCENWTQKQINMQSGKIDPKGDVNKIMAMIAEQDERFKPVKGVSGELRPIHSTFVEEALSRGAITGLSAENVDFIVHEGKSLNTAVVLPLREGLKSDIHAGFNVKYLPIPQRHEGNGLTVSAPSHDLPPHITNEKQIKRFLAEEYGVSPSHVLKLGESYFSHIGMTPHRIYPYAINVPPDVKSPPDSHFIPFYQMMLLQRSLYKEPHMMTIIARSYRYFNDALRYDAKLQVREIVKQRFEALTPDWSIPMSYDSVEGLRKNAKTKEITMQKLAVEKEAAIAARREITLKNELQNVKSFNKGEQGNQKRAFHNLNKQHENPIAPTPEQSNPAPDYAQDNVTPEQADEFEAELEAFMDKVEKEMEPQLRPEKW